MTDLHEEVLSAETGRVFQRLGELRELASFYLAGGTAVALQLGHRLSLDLDLFSERPWSWERIAPALASVGEVAVDRQEEGTFVGAVGGVRVSLFHYPYVLLEQPPATRFTIPLAGLTDIGCMKLVAVAQRGSRKDFIDLYSLGQNGLRVRELLRALERKVPGVEWNPVHILRSLAYFEDAESEPDPVMLVPYDWREVRRYCLDEAQALLDEVLGA
jgi:hypothetical protein